jgi:serine protease Do
MVRASRTSRPRIGWIAICGLAWLGAAPDGGPAGSIWLEPPAAGGRQPAGIAGLAALIERVRPAVVAVHSGGLAGADETPFRYDPWRLLPEVPPEQRLAGMGSGFVIHPDGWVLTNHHVVEGAEQVWVQLRGSGRRLAAACVGSDARSDLALLRIEAERPLPALPLGSSDALRPGDWVVAVGHPFGLTHVVTHGIVSGKGRALGDLAQGRSGFYDFIQTDAAIDRGNSGGPLLNLRGEVVGINTAINSRARGIGFAVPIDLVKAVLPHLRRRGRLVRSYLGIQVDDLSWEVARSFGLEHTRGVLITGVRPDTPAAAAGLRRGDVVLRLGGARIRRRAELAWRAATRPAGRPVAVVVWRGGERRRLEVVPAPRAADRTAEPPATPPQPPQPEAGPLGLRVVELEAEAARAAGLQAAAEGVVVVAASGLAAASGLRPGDVITEVDGRAIDGVAAFEQALAAAASGSMVRLYVLRQQGALFVALPKVWRD